MSVVTLGSLADLGYEVDATRADSYELPGSAGAAGQRPAGGAVFGGRGVRPAVDAVAVLPAALVQAVNSQ